MDAAKALECAQLLGVQGAQGVINFQVDQASSPEICAAYDDVPTIAIDIVQEPCEVAFMGANNREAGRLGGSVIGQYVADNWDCEYDAYVSLESTAAGAANFDRMGGYRDGFTEHCELDPAKEIILDGADRTDPALEQVSNLLPSLPGNRIIVVAINEDGILGALGAVTHAGPRERPHLQRPGHRPVHLEGRRLQPAVHRLGGLLPGALRASTVIPAMIDILDGKDVARNLFTAHEVITAENIRDIYPETPACDA